MRRVIFQRRASGPSSTVDLESLSMVHSIKILVAGQNTTVALDTGNIELWVEPVRCTAEQENIIDSDDFSANDVIHSLEYCKSFDRYDPASSPLAKDLQKRGHLRYADNIAIEPNCYTDNLVMEVLEISRW